MTNTEGSERRSVTVFGMGDGGHELRYVVAVGSWKTQKPKSPLISGKECWHLEFSPGLLIYRTVK